MTYAKINTTKSSIALFLAGFVTFATLYTTQPLLPLFAKEFGLSASTASLALSLSTFMLAISLVVTGTISDVIGRKSIMMASMFATSILGLLTAFSPSFWTLLLLRAFLGVALAGVPAIAMTYIGEEFQAAGLGKIMGLYVSGTSIGGMSGRLVTGFLTDLFSWRVALIVIGGMAIVMSIVFYLILPPSKNFVKKTFNKKEIIQSYVTHFRNKEILPIILLGFVFMGGFVTLYNYVGFYLMEPPYHLSQTWIGFIFIIYLSGTFSSVYMGAKADQCGNVKVIKISVLITIAGAILTLIPSLFIKIMGLAIFTFGFFASHSIASSWVGQTAKVNKAQASSLYLLFYYLGSSILGTTGGIFWMNFHWGGVVGFVVFLSFIGMILIKMVRIYQKQGLS